MKQKTDIITKRREKIRVNQVQILRTKLGINYFKQALKHIVATKLCHHKETFKDKKRRQPCLKTGEQVQKLYFHFGL